MSSFLSDALSSLFRVRLRPQAGVSLAVAARPRLLGTSHARGLIGPALAHLVCRLAERRLARLTAGELARLDDRMLRDIGIERMEVEYLQSEGPWFRRSVRADERSDERRAR